MKKLFSAFLIVFTTLVILSSGVLAATTTMYAPDGRTANVIDASVEDWKNVGWFESEFEAKIGLSLDESFYNNITNLIITETKSETGGTDTSTRFCFGYVNDDNIPDIFIVNGTFSEKTARIFIVKNGRIFEKVTFNTEDVNKTNFVFDKIQGSFEYIPRKGRVYTYGNGMSTFFDIVNYKCTEVCKLTNDAISLSFYTIGGNKATQLEYYDTLDAYYNDGVEYVKVDYETMYDVYEISEENIKKYYNVLLYENTANAVKMYSADGQGVNVNASDVESYRNEGWYAYPVRTLHSMDGRSAVVPAKDILAWVNVGWHTRNHITMWADEYTYQDVLLPDISSWKAVGWYDYPIWTIINLHDGSSKIVPEEEKFNYEQDGWYATTAYFKLHAPDGRTEMVNIRDVAAWKAVGWYLYPVTKLYALDGRTQVVADEDVEDWLNVGWYYEYDEVPMYSADGRMQWVYVKDVPANKTVGWYLTRQKSVDKMKKEIWNYVISRVNENLVVPGSGEYPAYDSNNVWYDGYNTFYVYLKYSAKNRLGVRVRGYDEYEVKPTPYGYYIEDVVDLWD